MYVCTGIEEARLLGATNKLVRYYVCMSSTRCPTFLSTNHLSDVSSALKYFLFHLDDGVWETSVKDQLDFREKVRCILVFF
jgi:hypothetical protein